MKIIVTALVLGAAFLGIVPPADATPDADCQPPFPQRGRPVPPGWNVDCGTHNMMIVGDKAMYLSHLPMFRSEHRFQVIARARLTSGGKDVTDLYLRNRASHPEVKMYTLKPADLFVLSRVIPKDGKAPPRASFDAAIFRGHLEREPNQLVDGLGDARVEIQEVIYAAVLPLAASSPRELRYVLFGAENGLYLAHIISKAPDFDQLVGVSVAPGVITADHLKHAVVITIKKRANLASKRLRAGETIEAQARVAGFEKLLSVRLTVASEFYFEQGELMVPAVFEQTPLERAAGF